MCAAVAAAAGLTFACTAPAAAYSDGAAQRKQAVEAEEELWPLEEQEPGETESTPFSMPGNGELVDDVEDGGTSKQFLTVQTKNGNTFYIVVDRLLASKLNLSITAGLQQIKIFILKNITM